MGIDYLSLTPRPLAPRPSVNPAATPSGSTAGTATEVVTSFKEMLGGMLGQTDALQQQSAQMTRQLATGEITNVHDVMIAAEKAKMAMQLTLAIRGKLLDAYQAMQQMR